jgi:hypothetical protein
MSDSDLGQSSQLIDVVNFQFFALFRTDEEFLEHLLERNLTSVLIIIIIIVLLLDTQTKRDTILKYSINIFPCFLLLPVIFEGRWWHVVSAVLNHCSARVELKVL